MPVAGLVRLRKHQFGRQAVFGTKVTADRAYPFSGVPSVELNWTDPEVDAGSLDPAAPPFRTASDLTAPLTDPSLQYDNIPLLMCGAFGGGVDPTPGGGGSFTWTHQPSSTTVDPLDLFTYQFGDDVLTDWYQLGDGIIETLEITGPEGLGPLTASVGWRFGSAASTGSTDSPVEGVVPTGGLEVDRNGTIVYLKDGAIYIADTTAGLAAAQITDALHTFTLRITNQFDQKRYANGDQLFDVDAYALASRAIELEATWAKTADTVGVGSESDDWFSDETVTRFVRLIFTSTIEAEAAVPYSWQITMPMRYYTRVEGEVGGNTVVILTGHAFYEPDDFGGVFESVLVNTLDSVEGGS